jgi:hypothetical protein
MPKKETKINKIKLFKRSVTGIRVENKILDFKKDNSSFLFKK